VGRAGHSGRFIVALLIVAIGTAHGIRAQAVGPAHYVGDMCARAIALQWTFNLMAIQAAGMQ
jgi:hypothetical protein